MELDKLLLIWIIILLVTIIIFIYLDYQNNVYWLDIIFKYSSNILSLIFFIFIYVNLDYNKIGSNNEIIQDIYDTKKIQDQSKYEDITTKELLELNINIKQKNIDELNNKINEIYVINSNLIKEYEQMNRILQNKININNIKLKKENDELANKININNKEIENIKNKIKIEKIQLQKYQKDYKSFLPTLVNKFLGNLLNKKTDEGHIYGLFPPSSGYGLF